MIGVQLSLIKFEAFLKRGESKVAIPVSISPKNTNYFERYTITSEIEQKTYSFSASNLFDAIETLLIELVKALNDPGVKIILNFDTYFESRLKSKSKSRELIDSKHFLIELELCVIESTTFKGDYDLNLSGTASFEDKKINLTGTEIQEIFDEIFYEFKSSKELRICLFCEHYMRFPGTNIHPMSSSSVCWVSQQKILKIIKKHPEKFEELFQTYIVHQINKESLDDQSEDGLIKFIDELTEGDEKLKKDFPNSEEFVERIVKLPRKTPNESCNLWSERKHR